MKRIEAVLKRKFEFIGRNQILEFILIHVYLNKNWNIYWSETKLTGLGPEDQYVLICITFFLKS
jgi:hypothetical protein